jgi:hypothetical protein
MSPDMKNAQKQTAFPHVDTPAMHHMQECMSICAACAKKCIEEGHLEVADICDECGDICALAIKSKSRRSESKSLIMNLCAQICKRCQQVCERTDTPHCLECAEVCKRCAECCFIKY